MRPLVAATCAVVALVASSSTHAQTPGQTPDAAARFGARPAIEDIRLSPDGSKVAYLSPIKGQGSVLMVMPAQPDATPAVATRIAGNPERLGRCTWVSESRFVCGIYGVIKATDGTADVVPFSRQIAIDSNGDNIQMLSTRQNFNSHRAQLSGGNIIDWLPGQDGQVLMTRNYIPNDTTGSRVGSAAEGVGVDRIDTATLKVTRVEPPRDGVAEYISDGHGNVRILGMARKIGSTEQLSGITSYLFRRKDSREWEKLGDYNSSTDEGFNPYAVDSDLDVAYGFQKTDGRLALWKIKLDGSNTRELVLARPDVDVDGLVRIGRRNRVVGASYSTDMRTPVYFDPEVGKVMAALTKAIPQQPLLRVVDSSVDERKLLIWAGADNDPGVHYLFDRDKRELKTFVVSRPELEGVKLATVKHISYPAADGTMIPGYLTLPPEGAGKNLPAIVLPHGGPSARDEWGFDWLSQYYAHQGYAVLQPNFRGSAGYGDTWFQQNGFRSWKTAIGDVSDAGRWLVKEGIADPKKLAIVGWSYGGYAALQSAVVDPALFKAVVAIAPVTDLDSLKKEWLNWTNYRLQADFIGSGAHITEGSPAQNAERIQVPVLMFHGDLDRNVRISQSTLMANRLERAGKQNRLVTFEGLDHQIEDSAARAQMLRESDAWLKAAFK